MIREFWILEVNIIPLFNIISYITEHDFNEAELDIIKYGLSTTSKEREIWFAHELPGKSAVSMLFAKDEEDTDIIFIKLTYKESVAAQIELALFIVQEFRLHRII